MQRPAQDSHEKRNTLKPFQTGRKKASLDNKSVASDEDETHGRAFEEKLKKKIKHDKSEIKTRGMETESKRTVPKSTTSELECQQNEDMISKKGITSTKGNKKSENIFYTDFPRRSLREKKESSKSYDKKMYRYL